MSTTSGVVEKGCEVLRVTHALIDLTVCIKLMGDAHVFPSTISPDIKGTFVDRSHSLLQYVLAVRKTCL